jgi:hypothetical protein
MNLSAQLAAAQRHAAELKNDAQLKRKKRARSACRRAREQELLAMLPPSGAPPVPFAPIRAELARKWGASPHTVQWLRGCLITEGRVERIGVNQQSTYRRT